MLPYQISAFVTHEINISSNVEQKTELFGSYSESDIKDHFEYIIKKHETLTDNPSIRIYMNKIENRITFEIKKCYLETINAWNNEIT